MKRRALTGAPLGSLAGGAVGAGPAAKPLLVQKAAVPQDTRMALLRSILIGVLPAGLAVEQPTQFDGAINQKTARALARRIPQALPLRADEVIG